MESESASEKNQLPSVIKITVKTTTMKIIQKDIGHALSGVIIQVLCYYSYLPFHQTQNILCLKKIDDTFGGAKIVEI